MFFQKLLNIKSVVIAVLVSIVLGCVHALFQMSVNQKVLMQQLQNLKSGIQTTSSSALTSLDLDSVKSNLVTTGYTFENQTNMDGSAIFGSFLLVSPTKEKIVIPDAVRKTLGQDVTNVTSFVMPTDEKDSQIIYMSSAKNIDEAQSRILNKVYSYNLKSSELKEVYSHIDEKNSPMSNQLGRVMRLVGRDGSKIILMADSPDNSPGPCTRIWSDYKDNMFYVDVSEVQMSLKSYIVPQSKVDKEKADADACASEMNNPSVSQDDVHDDELVRFNLGSNGSIVSKEKYHWDYTVKDLKDVTSECGKKVSDDQLARIVKTFSKSIFTKYTFSTSRSGFFPNDYAVTILPNTDHYKNMKEFNAIFESCSAGGTLYPFKMSENNLAFSSSCGSGYAPEVPDDASRAAERCAGFKANIEASLTLK